MDWRHWAVKPWQRLVRGLDIERRRAGTFSVSRNIEPLYPGHDWLVTVLAEALEISRVSYSCHGRHGHLFAGQLFWRLSNGLSIAELLRTRKAAFGVTPLSLNFENVAELVGASVKHARTTPGSEVVVTACWRPLSNSREVTELVAVLDHRSNVVASRSACRAWAATGLPIGSLGGHFVMMSLCVFPLQLQLKTCTRSLWVSLVCRRRKRMAKRSIR